MEIRSDRLKGISLLLFILKIEAKLLSFWEFIQLGDWVVII